MSERLAAAHGAEVWHADWRALLDVVPACSTLIVDAPYSERTQGGHDTGVSDLDGRRSLSYQPWTAEDVGEFVRAWSPRTSQWMVSITDHVLAPAWEAAMAAEGRLTFPPLPYVAPGSRVRVCGDGPSCWTCQVVVGRVRSREMATWGTLRGAYLLPGGYGEAMPVVGGKPLWLMERLAEDYSRPGDLICDPCCGAGTTLLGAIRTGRRAVGGDALREHAEIAAKRVSGSHQISLFSA